MAGDIKPTTSGSTKLKNYLPTFGSPVFPAGRFDIQKAFTHLLEEREKAPASDTEEGGGDDNDHNDDNADILAVTKLREKIQHLETRNISAFYDSDAELSDLTDLSDSDIADNIEETSNSQIKETKKRSRSTKRAASKRRKMKDAGQPRTRDKAKTRARHLKRAMSKAYEADFNIEKDFKVASSGYIGGRVQSERRAYSKDELVDGLRFEYIPWNGFDTLPIVDFDGRTIGVLAGPPKDPLWSKVIDNIDEGFQHIETFATITKKQMRNRRGDFASITHGYSFGNGQKKAINFTISKGTKALLQTLNESKDFRRFLTYTGTLYHTFNPVAFERCQETMRELQAAGAGDDPPPQPPYDHSCWPGTTNNIYKGGRSVVAYAHVDPNNDARGWCAITPFGSFDPDKGGHLVLWDLGLVIRFPAGCTALIPSALLRHANTPVPVGVRRSCIQFASGGLFRYLDNNCQTDKMRFSQMTPEERSAEVSRRSRQWKEAMQTLIKVSEK